MTQPYETPPPQMPPATYYPQPPYGPPGPTRPVWPTVIGIISTVLAGLIMTCGTFFAVMDLTSRSIFRSLPKFTFPPTQPISAPTTAPTTEPSTIPTTAPAGEPVPFPLEFPSFESLAPPDWILYTNAVIQFLWTVSAMLLLIGGIALLRRRPVSRPLHLAFAWSGVGLAVAGFAGKLAHAYAIRVPRGFFGMFGGMFRGQVVASAVLGLILQLAYPVFVLVWFYRRAIRSHVASWRQPPTAANIYQPPPGC